MSVVYLLNIIFSCFYLSRIRDRTWNFLIKISPVILLWVLIIGSQYLVGADYLPYLYYFNNSNDPVRYEPLFVFFVRLLAGIGIEGQGPFYFFAALNAIVFFIATMRLKIKHMAMFYFLFVVVSTFFNNQMNGLRQCIACVFVYWGFVEFYKRKFLGIILIFIAIGFHYSAVVCLFFVPIAKLSAFFTRRPKILLFATLVFSLMSFSNENLNNILLQYVPDYLKEEAKYEAMYLDNENLSKGTDYLFKLSKLVLLPVYWLSLKLLKNKNELSNEEIVYFRFGLLSFCLRNLFLINDLIARFSYYFWIPSIFPIYFIVRYYWRRKNYSPFVLLLLYCSIPYWIKIILAMAEYKYDSVFLH